jgi:hypothetical protein
MTDSFGCGACGSAWVVPPRELIDEALVRCGTCHEVLCTWGELKQRAERARRREYTREVSDGRKGARTCMASPAQKVD